MIFRKAIKIAVFAGVAMFLSNCFVPFILLDEVHDERKDVSSSILISILKPAQNPVDPKISQLGILNMSVLANSLRLKESKPKKINLDRFQLDSLGSLKLCDTMLQTLNGSVYLKSLKIPLLNQKSMDSSNFTDTLNRLCEQNHLDGIFIIQKFESQYVFNKNESNRHYNSYYRNSYQSQSNSLKIKIEVKGSIYSFKEKKFVKSYSLTKSFVAYTRKPLKEIQSFDFKENSMTKACHILGKDFASQLSPIWITVKRPYFTNGNSPLFKADRMLKNNQWDSAMVIWKKMSEDSSEVAKKYCYFNLALYYETRDNMDLSLEYVRKAKDCNLDKAKSYEKILLIRKEEIEKLKMQMN